MGDLSNTAIEHFKALELPLPHEELVAPIETDDTHWENRRQEVSTILIDPDLTIEEKTEKILQTEAASGADQARQEYLRARIAAIEAVLSDPDLTQPERFQLLAELETGKTGFGGHETHMKGITWILENTVKLASDGLILELVFTEPDKARMREFVGARPYKVDTRHLGYFRFERTDTAIPVVDPSSKAPLISADSGLYFRYTADVRQWLRANQCQDEIGFKVLGIHSFYQDSLSWNPYGGVGWETSSYPARGSAVFYGQEAIVEFIERMMSYSNEKLQKIKDDVSSYPGFGFIHEIQPKEPTTLESSRSERISPI